MVTVEGRLRGSNRGRTLTVSEGAWPWTGRPEMAAQTAPGNFRVAVTVGLDHCARKN